MFNNKKKVTTHRHGSRIVWRYTPSRPEGYADGLKHNETLDMARADPFKIVLGYHSLQNHNMANVLGVRQPWTTHGSPHLPAWVLPTGAL